MDLLALSDFIMVARHGGFSRASRNTGRPKATLSRRVADLEASLNLRLFERGGRDLKLTEEGRALYQRAGSLLIELEETGNAIASGGQTPRGRLRISVPLLFSQTVMGKLAAGFAAAYPEVRLEVTADDRGVDMIEEGYDLVIRVNPDLDEGLVGRAFLNDRLVIVSRPGLAPLSDGGPVPAILRGAADPIGSWTLTTARGPSAIAITPMVSLASMIMVRDATHAGIGVSRLPLSLVSADIAAGKLVLWGDADGPPTSLWALYPSRRLLSARVSAFLSYLKVTFPTGAPEELAGFIG